MITLLKKLAASVVTPAANKVTLFIDSVTGKLNLKDEAGTVVEVTTGGPYTEPGDLATVATSGLYSDLTGVPLKGTAVLVAGTVTVAEAATAIGSVILLTSQVDGGTPGFLRVSARTDGVDFTITSSDPTDTSTVGYVIYN